MPMMSDAQIVRLQGSIASDKSTITKLRTALKSKERVDSMSIMGIGLGSAAVVGFARGKLEAANGEWNIAGIPVDIESLVVLGLAGVALAGDQVGLKKWQVPAAVAVAGIGGHYVGQVARNTAKSGKFSLVAGSSPRSLVAGQYDPYSYNPTQITSPFADPVAASLAASGV